MTGRQCADDVCVCRQHADDVPACRQCADDICHLPAQISNEVSLSCRLHIVRASYAETSVPRLFQVKQQRTALLKSKVKLVRMGHAWLMLGCKDLQLKFLHPCHLRVQKVVFLTARMVWVSPPLMIVHTTLAAII